MSANVRVTYNFDCTTYIPGWRNRGCLTVHCTLELIWYRINRIYRPYTTKYIGPVYIAKRPAYLSKLQLPCTSWDLFCTCRQVTTVYDTLMPLLCCQVQSFSLQCTLMSSRYRHLRATQPKLFPDIFWTISTSSRGVTSFLYEFDPP